MKLTDAEIDKIIDEAFKLAADKTAEVVKANPGSWYPCGFARVNIKPGRGPFVRRLKARGIGHLNDYTGGYDVYNPSKNDTQWMDAKYLGAVEFAYHLQQHGVKCQAISRID